MIGQDERFDPSKRYADYQCWNNATKENNVASDELDLSVVNELTNEFASVRANRVARNSVTALGVVEASVDQQAGTQLQGHLRRVAQGRQDP